MIEVGIDGLGVSAPQQPGTGPSGAGRPHPLTAREREVLATAAGGATAAEVARAKGWL